jgi:Flp pilus assembly protein TadG
MILVAAGLVIGILILALVINSGFGLAQRRTMQNAADAGALAAAQLLASNVTAVNGNPPTAFRVTDDYVYCVAKFYADRNRDSFRPDADGRTESITVQWSPDPYNLSNGGTLSPASCPPPLTVNGQQVPAPVTTGTAMNASARYIRVEAQVNYDTLVAVVGPPKTLALASALARIAGAQVPASGPTWPMIRHYNPSDFTCTGQCNPLSEQPTTFWSATGGQNDQDVVFGSFKGLTDLSRFGPNANKDAPNGVSQNCTGTLAPACVPQLMTDYDHRVITITDPARQYGSQTACDNGNVSYPTPPAPPDWWLASGGESSQVWDKDCSLQNWAGYTFTGTLSLTTDWTGAASPQEPPNDGQALPTATSNPPRTTCQGTVVGLARPSCVNGTGGDWIEVGQQTGNQGVNISGPLAAYIAANGVADGYSGLRNGNGQGAPFFGKKVVMLVYLWDCSETYTNDGSHTQALRNQWSLNLPRTGPADCSAIHQGQDMNAQDTVSRVHLFTLASFTFYEGTVSSQLIQGFWGGWLDPSSPCQIDPTSPQCTLNEFANTAFLVGE